MIIADQESLVLFNLLLNRKLNELGRKYPLQYKYDFMHYRKLNVQIQVIS